ncbi:hypothetical protein ACOSQ4_014033 [Xanthoceras sorbifolium]
MPLSYWWKAFHTAVYTINRLRTVVLQHQSPYSMAFHRIPYYANLKTFGTTCFPYLRSYSKHKFNFHSSKCIFIRYSDSHKGYKCFHHSGRIYISKHVLFHEGEFSYSTLFQSSSSAKFVSVASQLQYLHLFHLLCQLLIPRLQGLKMGSLNPKHT